MRLYYSGYTTNDGFESVREEVEYILQAQGLPSIDEIVKEGKLVIAFQGGKALIMEGSRIVLGDEIKIRPMDYYPEGWKKGDPIPAETVHKIVAAKLGIDKSYLEEALDNEGGFYFEKIENNDMPSFEETEKLVKERIKGFRKGTDDVPNYTHSFHVRDLLKKYGFREVVQMAGLLHDIVEDGDTSFDELRELGYPEEVIELVDLATHNMNIKNPTDEQKFQRWKDMMKRLEEADNKDAWAIKLADITDNVAGCHTMANNEKKMRFMCIKCPYFIVQGRKIFGESDFYMEFTKNYTNQLLRYIDFTKVGHWENGEFFLTPEIHMDEKGKYIYLEGVVFKAVYGTKNYTGFGYASFNGGNYNAFYIGEWVEGKRTGYGWIFYEDGDTYNGNLVDGVRDGIGEMNMPEIGEFYGGERKDDKMHGYGRWRYSDGGEYVGYWVNGKQEGKQGIRRYSNGDVYVGDFVGGKREGEGLYVYNNGAKIFSRDGRKNDDADGDFIYESPDGKRSACRFKDGELVEE